MNKRNGKPTEPRDRNMTVFFRLKQLIPVMLALVLLFSAVGAEEEYIIGPEDVLQISFWQDPTLNQQVKVRQDGKITLSIIGEIMAAGLTSSDLADKIQSNVSLYNKKISQAAVTVVEFNSQKVFLSGQVRAPGKMTFEVIPDLWTLIKEAGGAAENGDLTRVTIIRSQEEGGERIVVNLLEAIATGRLDDLPEVKSGDTVEIPKMAGGVPGRQLTEGYTERKNLYYVLGEVRSPGTKSYEEGLDLFDALGAANGATQNADLENVRVISKQGQGSTVIRINMKKYRDQGQPRRLRIKPEDTIVIGQKKGSIISWSTLRDFAAVAGTIISFVYLIDRQ